jgi:hypothetical protein
MTILLATLLAAAAPATAPSFDCSRELSRTERLICADPWLAQSDRVLALAYSRAAPRQGLVGEQREWLARRDGCESRDCLVYRYEHRISTLLTHVPMPLRYSRPGYRDDPAFLGMRALGNGEYLFKLVALHYQEDRTNVSDGIADGLVRIENGRGVWRDSEGCTLAFTRERLGWAVRESGPCRSGIGAELGGHYRR